MLGLVMIMVVLINSMFNLSSTNGSFPLLMFEALLIVKMQGGRLAGLKQADQAYYGNKDDSQEPARTAGS